MKGLAKTFPMIALVVCAACEKAHAPADAPPQQPVASKPIEKPRTAFVSVRGQSFVDPEGREVVLRGMAVISKDPKANYQSWHGPEEFARMRAWGMNCVRLGIIWDGLEPQSGAYDEAYLKKVDERIDWARQHGLYVFLDMHQDLFSVKYSDGAPAWATLDEGLPHATGAVWSDSYQISQAVKKSFDNFWANKPGPGGVGVQDRFALAWRHVANRYKDNPTVIGYDLFNEPNQGSGAPDFDVAMLSAFGDAIASDGAAPPDLGAIAAQWLDPNGRSEIMTQLRDIAVYTKVVDGPEAIVQKFEREHVVPMYQRVADKIREVDSHHILFLETLMACNMGIRTGIEPLTRADGTRDPQQAYAPHGYDIVVDTPDLTNASNDRVHLIFDRHAESGIRLGMPVLIGEWGAYGGAGAAIVPTAEFNARQFEKHLFSDTYWDYGREIKDAPHLTALSRAAPVCVAGALVSYANDPAARTFTCVWKEDPAVAAPTRVYLPERCYTGHDAIAVEPAGAGFTIEPVANGETSAHVVVPPTGQAVERRMTVKW